jgi:hypothetical protein
MVERRSGYHGWKWLKYHLGIETTERRGKERRLENNRNRVEVVGVHVGSELGPSMPVGPATDMGGSGRVEEG